MSEPMTRAPTTLHERFRVDPRGADSFGKWIEDRIWELLQRPAIRQCRLELSGVWYAADNGPLSAMIRQCTMYDQGLQRRVVLLNGTIVKEWVAASEATTDRASKVADRVGG